MVGSTWNKASSDPLELGLGLSLAKNYSTFWPLKSSIFTNLYFKQAYCPLCRFFWCLLRLLFVSNCWLQCTQACLTCSCTAFWCLAWFLFEVDWWLHFLQGYLTPSCTAFWCSARFTFEVNWWLHCPQGCLTPSCTALWCWAIFSFEVAWWLDYVQMYWLLHVRFDVQQNILSDKILYHIDQKGIRLLHALPYNVKPDFYL